MATLETSHCEPCRSGATPLTDAEIRPLLAQVPGWAALERDGVWRIERTYEFPNFRSALDFTVKVGELAEAEQHHPDIHLSWGRVRVETWTHKIQGLHANDFILAAKVNAAFAG